MLADRLDHAGCSASSTSTPPKDFGCTKITRVPWAPGVGPSVGEPVALGPQPRDVAVEVVGAEAEVVQTAPALFEEGLDRPLAVERVHELDARRGEGKEGGAGLGRRHVLGPGQPEPEVLREPADRFGEIRNRDGDVIEADDQAEPPTTAD